MTQTAELTPTTQAATSINTYLHLRRQADIAALRGKAGNANPDERITMQFDDDIPTFTITFQDFTHILDQAQANA